MMMMMMTTMPLLLNALERGEIIDNSRSAFRKVYPLTFSASSDWWCWSGVMGNISRTNVVIVRPILVFKFILVFSFISFFVELFLFLYYFISLYSFLF